MKYFLIGFFIALFVILFISVFDKPSLRCQITNVGNTIICTTADGERILAEVIR
jgi:hypothetical protein